MLRLHYYGRLFVMKVATRSELFLPAISMISKYINLHVIVTRSVKFGHSLVIVKRMQGGGNFYFSKARSFSGFSTMG